MLHVEVCRKETKSEGINKFGEEERAMEETREPWKERKDKVWKVLRGNPGALLGLCSRGSSSGVRERSAGSVALVG